MTALIFGLDLSINGTASQIMSHERAVKTAFLASAPQGTTAEIVISGNSSVIDGQADLYARIPKTSTAFNGAMIDLYEWLAGGPDRYDVMVFGYTTGAGWYAVMDRILRDYSLTSFSPMNNASSAGTGFLERFGNNVFFIGTGTTENTAQRGYRMTGYTTASPSALTSYTTARSAGLYLHCKAQGGTLEQVRKRFIQNFAGYPDKSVQNGFGSVPTTYTDTTTDLLPPTALWAYLAGSTTSGGILTSVIYYLYFAPFYPQTQDAFRIYRNGVLIYEGQGQSIGQEAYIGTADTRLHIYTTTVGGTSTFSVTSVLNDVESDATAYASDTVNIPNIPQPEPSPEPPSPPNPEPDIPPVNPNPNVFLSRSNYVLLATTDGGGDVTQWRYRTSIIAEWTSHTGSTFAITPDPTKTYEVQARVSSGGVFTDWSESAYSTSTATSTQFVYYP
jgi:hypothetical protein